MNVKNIKVIMVFLVLLICILGTVSATEDVSVDTVTDAPEHVSTQTVQEDSSNALQSEKSVDDSICNTNNEAENTLEGIKQNDNNKVNDPGTVVDFYVSDVNGSDDNDGSQANPFKTVKKAIDSITEGNTYNIYILEGVYKGVGNTNLTVNGNYNINFIGSGVGKSVFDGEANFTIPGEGNPDWGGSAFWNNWYNCSGNWIMNITEGSGIINLCNLTIQNAWNNAGSAITLCYSATIDNRATLYVRNVYFNKNHAGAGAGIRNNFGGTLFVDNCTFENGTKAQTTGNFGAAIYNNGTAVLTNTFIINNYGRWGSVTNDKNITLINCTFRNNHAYDGGSGYKNGPSFTADTGFTNFYQMYAVYNLTSTLINCTFADNEQADISNGRGDLIVNNCLFNHSTGVYLFPNTNKKNTYIPHMSVTNCQFIDMQPSTIFATTISSTTPSVAIRSLAPYPLLIENNTIDVRDPIYGYGLYLTTNATVRNNTLNNFIYVDKLDNIIVNNTINTTKEFTIFLSSTSNNTSIFNNTLIGGYTVGDLSLAGTVNNLSIENNQPVASTYVISEENYMDYFDEFGVLKKDVIVSGSKIIFTGDFTNKKFIFDDIVVSISGNNSNLINTTIISRNNAKILLQNFNILNDNCNEVYAILLNSSGNLLRNITMTAVSANALQAIRIEEDGNIISNSTIFLNAAAADTEWNDDLSIKNIPTIGILIRSSNNLLNVTKVFVNGTHSVVGATMPSVYGVAIVGKTTGEYLSGNELRSSRVNVEGGEYGYGLVLSGAQDTYTTLSWYNVSSTDYAYGVQVGDGINNTIAGYIYSYGNIQAYAAYITSKAPNKSYNTNFNKLYIQDMYAPEVIAVCVDGASGVELSNATYNIRGENIKIVDIHKDNAGNLPEYIFINAITMKLNFTNINSTLMNISNTKNLTITNNVIPTNVICDGIILTNVTEAVVANNYINIANMTGGDYVVSSLDSTVIVENNSPAIVRLDDESYANYFDSEGNLIVTGSGVNIFLIGDLHNKDLNFFRNASINFTNLGNYIIYNGTITFKGESDAKSFDYNIIGINFKNTDKAIIKDLSSGDVKRTLKFNYCTVEMDGNVLTAFDVFNNKSNFDFTIQNSNFTMNGNDVVLMKFAGLSGSQSASISNCNINLTGVNTANAFLVNNAKTSITYVNFTMDGNDVVLMNFSGLNTTPDETFNNNNVNLTGVNSAILLSLTNAKVDFCDNVISQKAKTSITANLTNCTISSKYYFDGNIINSEGDFVAVAIFINDKANAYVYDCFMNLTSPNPITAINATGIKSLTVTENKIYVNTLNGEVPVIYIENPSSTVSNNYILAEDVYGNAAVADTGITIKDNTPIPAHIDYQYEQGSIFKENNMTFIITNDEGEIVTGDLKVFINDEEVEVINNTIKFVPTTLLLNVYAVYTDPNNVYAKTEIRFTEETGLDIIKELNETVKEQNETINELNSTVVQQNQTISELEQKIKELEERLNNLTKPTKITAVDVSKVYNVDKNYVVYLKDGLGNAIVNARVTVIIDNKKYIKTTDENGQITIPLENLKPATYTTSINYDGDSNHNPASLTTSKILVSKATVKMTASNKSFKLSVSTKKYVVTMKTNTNQVMKNAAVSLKINGKTYSAKTNAKGQATFKITNLKKKATYTAVVTFKQTDCYNAVTKKAKIIVK